MSALQSQASAADVPPPHAASDSPRANPQHLLALNAFSVFATTGGRGGEADALLSLCTSTWGDEMLGNGVSRVRLGRLRRTRLMYAAMKGNISRVAWWLDRKCDVNAATASMYWQDEASDDCAVTLASRGGHTAVLQFLVDRGALLVPACLDAACAGGHVPVLELLFDRGVNPVDGEAGTRNPEQGYRRFGRQPQLRPPGRAMIVACKAGHVAAVQFLLSRGYGAEQLGEGLRAACGGGHLAMARVLLDLGIPVDLHPAIMQPHSNGGTPLHAACIANSVECATLLLERGASVSALYSASSYLSNTPLHLAGRHGGDEMVSLLLRYGADLSARTSRGNTPIDLSMDPRRSRDSNNQGAWLELALATLERGPPFSDTLPRALDWAIPHFPTAVLSLLERGMEGKRKHLIKACVCGHVDVVRWLLTHGVDPNSSPLLGREHDSQLSGSRPLSVTSLGSFFMGGGVRLFSPGENIQMGPLYAAVTCLKDDGAPSTAILQLLTDYGAHIDGSSRPGAHTTTPLQLACSTGNLAAARWLIERGADVRAHGLNSNSPLHELLGKIKETSSSEIGLLDLLLLKGADAAELSPGGATPFSRAVNNIEAVKLLLQYGAAVNIPDRNGSTPLQTAIFSRNSGVSTLLFAAGARLDGVSLLSACAAGMTDIVAALLDRGDHVDGRLEDDRDVSGLSVTPLHVACGYGHADMIRLLLSRGASATAETAASPPLQGTRDPYSFSSRNDIDASSNFGCTALSIVCGNAYRYGSEWYMDADTAVDIAAQLLDRGADLHALDARELTPLHYSVCGDDELLTRLLLSRGADAAACGISGITPLHMAVMFGNAAAIRMLIDSGASPNSRLVRLGYADDYCREFFRSQYTPLLLAVMQGDAAAVTALLEGGADVHAPEIPSPTRSRSWFNFGFSSNDAGLTTALHLACERGYMEIARVLLLFGADLHAVTASGMTASDLAESAGFPRTAAFLGRGDWSGAGEIELAEQVQVRDEEDESPRYDSDNTMDRYGDGSDY